MNINFDLYKTFYSVAKNKNITKAAHELMISQPAVSKAIKTLEEQLGCCLFIRNKYGVILTEEGESFYNNIKMAIEMIDNAEQKLQEMMNLEYGLLKIGISNTLTQKYLLPYIEQFHKNYPNIKIKISTSPSYELITQVRNGLIDFIILNLPYDLPSDFKKFELKKVCDCFIANDNWKHLKGKMIPLKELEQYPLILISKGANTRNFLDNFCQANNINLAPEMEVASHSLITAFTKIGLGIGYGTKEFLRQELEEDILFEVKTDPKIPDRAIGCAYLKQKELSKAAKTFLNLLKEKETN